VDSVKRAGLREEIAGFIENYSEVQCCGCYRVVLDEEGERIKPPDELALEYADEILDLIKS